METAPLTLAHAHARRASYETSKSKLTVAATEHESAAGEFAKAAKDTHDAEALRILSLLEEHHHRLADIIRTKNVISNQLSEVTEPVVITSTSPDPTNESTASSPPPSTLPDASSPPNRALASAFTKMQHARRDSSPALAKDMASRRGIPQPHRPKTLSPVGQRTTSTPHSDTKSHRRKHSSKQREIVEAPSAASAAQLPKPQSTSPDDGFSRFYSNLTSGPFSKISSMLAFAALPLTETPSEPPSPTSSRSEKTSARAHNEPDFKDLISPAALNALEEHQRRQGHSGQVFGPGESFYVVPPSGGTASYANIMRADQRFNRRQHGHLSHISEDDNEFVDARETQGPRSTGSGSGSFGKAGGGGGAGLPPSHRVEELELENDTLKQVLDQLSHRLQAFERSAQDASMAALTQSMASVRTTGAGGGGHRHDETALAEREKMMEDELQMAVEQITKLREQNRKYKDYYDKLKASARQKERAKREQGEAASMR